MGSKKPDVTGQHSTGPQRITNMLNMLREKAQHAVKNSHCYKCPKHGNGAESLALPVSKY